MQTEQEDQSPIIRLVQGFTTLYAFCFALSVASFTESAVLLGNYNYNTELLIAMRDHKCDCRHYPVVVLFPGFKAIKPGNEANQVVLQLIVNFTIMYTESERKKIQNQKKHSTMGEFGDIAGKT